MKVSNRLLALSLAMAMSATLAACGSSDAGTSDATSDSSSSSASSAESAADADSTGSTDGDVTVVNIGISTDSMPNCYLDENGNLAGENYEVMCLVDEALPQYEFHYEPLTQDVILTGMDTGTYQVGIFNAWYTDERAEKYLYPKYPVSGGVNGLVLRADSGITGGTQEEILEQVAAKGLTPVPVSPGDASDTSYSEYNENHPDQPINYEAVEEIDISTSIRYIMQGRYDCAQFFMSNYTSVEDEVDPDNETVFLPYDDGGFGTWVVYAKGQEDLVNAVDGVMQQMFADGTMAAISEKYYGENVFQYVSGFEYADVAPNPDYAG